MRKDLRARLLTGVLQATAHKLTFQRGEEASTTALSQQLPSRLIEPRILRLTSRCNRPLRYTGCLDRMVQEHGQHRALVQRHLEGRSVGAVVRCASIAQPTSAGSVYHARVEKDSIIGRRDSRYRLEEGE